MTSVEPSQFYTGLVAQLYAPLRGSVADVDACERFVRASGQPALELGCGHGYPLIELRQRGLDVEGLDSSGDMLDLARAGARVADVAVVLHHASMETMSLGTTYQSIFLAGPTFNLLPDDAVAVAALAAIRAHLASGGLVQIPLFIPQPLKPEALGFAKQLPTAAGGVMRCTTVSVERDEAARTQAIMLRYELDEAGVCTVVERPWLLHWYTPAGFTALVEAAGLAVVSLTDHRGRPLRDGNWQFVFTLAHPSVREDSRHAQDS